MAWRTPSIRSTHPTTHKTRNLKRLLAGIAAVPLMSLLPQSAHGNLYWDQNGITAGAGTAPAGTWGVDLAWNDQADGTDGAGAGTIAGWTSGETAIFSAGDDAIGTYTVTVFGTQTIGGLNLEEGTATLTGGILDIDPTGVTINTAASTSLTIESIIGGGASARLTKTEPGTLFLGTVLNQANSYGGGVTLSSGLTVIQGENSGISGNPNALGAAPAAATPGYLQMSNGAILRSTRNSTNSAFILPNRGVTLNTGGGGFDVSNAAAILAYAGKITGTGGLTKLGAGQLTLTGTTSDFSGGIITSAGILSITGASTFTGGITVNNGAAFIHNGETSAAPGAASTSGAVPGSVISNYVTLDNGIFTSTKTGAGVTFLATNKGITLNAGGGTLSVTDTLASNFNVYAGVITGVGSLTKSGVGTLALTNVQTYQGSTTINAGTLRLRTNPNLIPNASAVIVNTPGVFDLATFSEMIGSLAGTGNIVADAASTGTLTTGGDGTPTAFSGNIQSTTGGATTLKFIKTGAGTQTLTGMNAISTVTVTGGVLAANSSNAIGSSGTNDLVLDGGALQATGTITSNARNVTVNSGGGTIDADAGNSAAFGTVAGSGSFTKTGDATLTAAHTRVSTLNITGGTLQIAPNALAAGVSTNSTLSIVGGKLDLTDNKLITASPAGIQTAGVYNDVQGLVQSGYNGGGWNGTTGIVTSQSDALGTLTTIGVTTGALAQFLAPTDTSIWAGQTINGDSTMVMYTYIGDANLDGIIDGTDYFYIDNNIGTSADGYGNGDFNYDGIVDGTDYFYIDSNIVDQGAPFFAADGAELLAGVTAVPEPASGAIFTAFLLGSLNLHRRRRKSDMFV